MKGNHAPAAEGNPQNSSGHSRLAVMADKFVAAVPAGMRTLMCCAVIIAVAFCVFIVNRADPPHIFWDENYHVTSTERYLEGMMQFEPHPPLGLMMIAVGEYFSHANDGVDMHALVRTKEINGDDMPANFSFAGMRLMPSLFAAFGALLFFALIYELLENRLYALLFTSLYVFENAFVVHFRATHLDSFQMFFTLGSLWYFARLWKSIEVLKWWQYALLAVWCALAMMVKVNAVFLVVLFPMLYIKDVKQHPKNSRTNWVADAFTKGSSSLVAALAVFFMVFYVHALFSRNPPDANTPAGQQDIANMSPRYREYIDKHEALTPVMVYIIARDYFHFMYKDHEGVPKLNPNNPGENGSYPWHWPFHDRNINYRWDSADGKTAYVQLVGNQLAWYCGTASVILALILVINYRIFAVLPRGSMRTYSMIEAFTLLYVAFMALNLWMISQRVLYLYHYFMGLAISYALLTLMWKYLCEIHPRFNKHRLKILATTVSLFALSYWFFLPLTNHYPMTKQQCERRNVWISHIVDCQ